jgi:hypothetical protein
MAFGFDDAIAAGLEIINKFVPDPQEKIKAEQALRDSLLASDKGQLEVNKAEAASQHLFVAGWRPAIGWCCALALGFQYVVSPLVLWGGDLVGHPLPVPPKLDDILWELMFAMLGMGGLRTYEKIKGVARSK